MLLSTQASYPKAVLPWLSDARLRELAAEAVELYCWDRLGSDN